MLGLSQKLDRACLPYSLQEQVHTQVIALASLTSHTVTQSTPPAAGQLSDHNLKVGFRMCEWQGM